MDAELKSFLENMQTNIQEKLSQFQSRFNNLETQISIMQDSQSKVKIDIKEIKNGINELKVLQDYNVQQMGRHDAELHVLKYDLNSLKENQLIDRD